VRGHPGAGKGIAAGRPGRPARPAVAARPGSGLLGAAPLPGSFFARRAEDVAPELVGKLLVRSDGRVARLVEVEAYLGLEDPGSHAWRGPTPRAAIMFGPPGRLYVYFSYGVHWCANVVCGPVGVASAVLLRAAQPMAGLEAMFSARSSRRAGDGAGGGGGAEGGRKRVLREVDLCRGPARLAQAFGIDGADNGLDLATCGHVWLGDDGAGPGGDVVVTPRVGLSASRGAELPLRYVLQGSPWASPGPRTALPP
jgi:DNA-3-methyladenine glycosylase